MPEVNQRDGGGLKKMEKALLAAGGSSLKKKAVKTLLQGAIENERCPLYCACAWLRVTECWAFVVMSPFAVTCAVDAIRGLRRNLVPELTRFWGRGPGSVKRGTL